MNILKVENSLNCSKSLQDSSTLSLNKNILFNSTPNSSYLIPSVIKKEHFPSDSSGNTLKKIKIKKKKLNQKSNSNESYAASDPSTTTKTINEKQIIDLIEVKEESLKYKPKAKETNSHKEFKVYLKSYLIILVFFSYFF